jgi:hypothetical protein
MLRTESAAALERMLVGKCTFVAVAIVETVATGDCKHGLPDTGPSVVTKQLLAT